MAQDARERFAKKNEAEDLRRAFDKLDTKGDGKIDAQELREVLLLLRHETKKSEVEDIIWEVDDDSDKCVSWSEFQAMCHRCRVDQTGYEPRRLFNIVEFVMNDRDGSGSVSVEEATQILYLRFGNGLLDKRLEEIFGTSDTNSTKDLSLTEFLKSVTPSCVKQLRSKAA
mmetsp:Transcript_3065/g.11425  ORF Transcript_3065/g.11425 Transcript_3065/m.11425 type:complete len:170 (+) Transcript_3065:303-812(+)